MQRARAYQDSEWQPRLVNAGALRPWLQARGSLTAKLKAQFDAVSIQGLQQGWRPAHRDECRLLHLRSQTRVWVREVVLTAYNQPLVFAHSVIAREALRGPWCRLPRLGRVPLGAALFADARIQRGDLHFRRLSRQHPLQRAVSHWLPQAQSPRWARRSMFKRGQAQLLVTEVFLLEGLRAAARLHNPLND